MKNPLQGSNWISIVISICITFYTIIILCIIKSHQIRVDWDWWSMWPNLASTSSETSFLSSLTDSFPDWTFELLVWLLSYTFLLRFTLLSSLSQLSHKVLFQIFCLLQELLIEHTKIRYSKFEPTYERKRTSLLFWTLVTSVRIIFFNSFSQLQVDFLIKL